MNTVAQNNVTPASNRARMQTSFSGQLSPFRRTLGLKMRSISGEPEKQVGSYEATFPTDWSPDGRFIAAHITKAKSDVLIIPMTHGEKPHDFAPSSFNKIDGHFSLDGRSLA